VFRWRRCALLASKKHPLWQTLVTEVIAQTEGRTGPGSVNHCMHGPDLIVEHVSDWRPFSYITVRYDVADIEGWMWTCDLDETDAGTSVTIRLSDPGGDGWATYGEDFTASVRDQAEQLQKLLTAVPA
jgi:hypothetical protein